MVRKERICAMCEREIDERDDVVVITKEPGEREDYYEPELIAVLCVECYNGGTSERPVNLNELPHA